jgi:hypothetical protein
MGDWKNGPGLTEQHLREAMDRMDGIMRPWRGFLLKCSFKPNEWVERGQLFVAFLGGEYFIIGHADDLSTAEQVYIDGGVPKADVPRAIVWYQWWETIASPTSAPSDSTRTTRSTAPPPTS